MESDFCKEGISVSLSSPIGIFQISGCSRGMHFVKRESQDLPSQMDMAIKCQILDTESDENLPIPVQQCIEWLCKYFSMDKITFENKSNPVVSGWHPPICPRLGISKSKNCPSENDFIHCLLLLLIAQFRWQLYNELASEIKFGNRISYSGLAEIIQFPKAQRAVGTSLKNNRFMIIIPCHRVIQKSGKVGSYQGGTESSPLKEWLLNYEQSFLEK